MKKRGESGQWLDYYARYQFVEFYRTRIVELASLERNLIKVLVEKTQKEEKTERRVKP